MTGRTRAFLGMIAAISASMPVRSAEVTSYRVDSATASTVEQPTSPNQSRAKPLECPPGSKPQVPSLVPETIFGAAWPPQPEPSVAGGYETLRPLNVPKVRYPSGKGSAGIGALIHVLVLVDTAGRIEDARVICSNDEGFHKPVLDAMRSVRFTPSRVDGKPIKDVGLQPFDFRVVKK